MATKTFNEVKINVAFTEAANPSGQTHAGNIDGSTGTGHEHGQDLATTLGIIKNWYSHWHSVVWTGDAATVSGFSVGKAVPADAVFTDTDTKVNMTKDNTTKAYLLGSSTAPTTTAQAVTSIADEGIFLTTTAGRLQMGSLAITSGSYANIVTSASVTSANVTQTLPAKTGTILNTATTSFTQTLSSGTKIGTIKINDVETDLYCSAGSDTHVNVTKAETTKAYLLGTSTTPTGTAAAVESVADTGVYLSTTAGELVATNFSGKINNHTVAADVPSGAVFTDTTYTFAEGSANGKFSVTPSGGSAQSVTIHGLDTAAYAKTTDFTAAKPDGTHDLVDSTTHLINTEYLPSYVDDVIEGYYNSADGKFYTTRTGTSPNYSYSGEITGESGKIYLDIGVTPAEAYRWGGSAYASLKQPTISAVANVVYKSNGEVTVSYTDGTASADVTVYTHPTTAGNKHIPSGGSAGKFLGWSSSGTATWQDVPAVAVYQGATASAAGVTGTVPAAAAGQNSAHYLRGDGTWSNDPVIEADTLILNVVAAS